jgi:proteasome lid subunit RPN8/RPN11
MSERQIKISATVEEALKTHARAATPNECCGLLAGKNGVITISYPLRNCAEYPQTRYAAAPEDLFAAMRRMREAGLEFLGIYHSHPRSPAYPSSTDIELAFYPEAIYFIISLQREIEILAFNITDSLVEEVEILTVHHL